MAQISSYKKNNKKKNCNRRAALERSVETTLSLSLSLSLSHSFVQNGNQYLFLVMPFSYIVYEFVPWRWHL